MGAMRGRRRRRRRRLLRLLQFRRRRPRCRPRQHQRRPTRRLTRRRRHCRPLLALPRHCPWWPHRLFPTHQTRDSRPTPARASQANSNSSSSSHPTHADQTPTRQLRLPPFRARRRPSATGSAGANACRPAPPTRTCCLTWIKLSASALRGLSVPGRLVFGRLPRRHRRRLAVAMVVVVVSMVMVARLAGRA
ncbi:hypothetical protein BC831DRAFT_482962 [Entophlyctis helioformis]|nr:hypothetical protein BC831DRAFT_482962 [Entophlyctis helioformis]